MQIKDLQMQDEEVTPIAFGNHIHWVVYEYNADGSVKKTIGANGRIVPVVNEGQQFCAICYAEDKAYRGLLSKLGAEQLAAKVNKLASYRLYDRKYPYDSTGKAANLEDVILPGEEDETLEQIIADEAVNSFMSGLTQTEQDIANLLLQGYKPRDIAKMWGKPNSGSVRWHKHQIKRKLGER